MDYSVATAALKKSDKKLARYIDLIGDCYLVERQDSGDLLYSLARAIIYQQLSTKAAATIHQRLLNLYTDLPTATDLLKTTDDDFRSVGISRQKISYLRDLAARVQNGLPTIADLHDMDDETIIQTLTQVKGIGRWTVEMLLIFRLHRWDVLPVDDLGIRMGVQIVHKLAERPDKKMVQAIGQAWMPYRTIASWYLWRCLEL
jgi:DNA-3-methyladenine glycosylase II